MKVLVNGGLNVSILDGWWDEAIDSKEPTETRPGWIVGSRKGGSFDDLYRREAASVFDVLEHYVIPEFYDRDEDGIAHCWVERAKESMARLTPRLSATRMLHEYIEQACRSASSRICLTLCRWRETCTMTAGLERQRPFALE